MPMTPGLRAGELLREAAETLPLTDGTRRARLVLAEQADRLAQPLRIALVGKVSSGKSTLVNALVGAPVTVTGRGPVTLAVTVLRYAETPSWTVHYADGATQDVPDLEHLAAFTARAAGGDQVAAAVDYVQVLGRYPGLRRFELVDTPGFDSPHNQDTDNALRAIGATRASVLQASVARLRSADAIIAILQHAVSGPDADVLRRFHAADGEAFVPTPLTAMAVLTKAEEYWPAADDPLAAGMRDARLIMKGERARRVFHRVIPVCGKVAAAAATLTDEDLADLRELATVADLGRLVRNAAAFIRDDGLPLAKPRRQRLLSTLDRYGVWLAWDLIRRRGVTDAADLRHLLDEGSGLSVLRAELSDRFAVHSDLIKVARAVQVTRAAVSLVPPGASDRDRDVVARAVESITSLTETEPSFAEFEMLRRHYANELDVPEAAGAELVTAAGEHGTTVAERLGQPASAPPADLARAALAKASRWSGPLPELGSDARALARVMRRRYEESYVRARQAQAALGEIAQLDGDREATPGDAEEPGQPPRGAELARGEPVLVVDLGTTSSSAILIDGRRTDIAEPSGKPWWPTLACERDGRLLVGSAAEAARRHNPLAFCTEFKPDIGSPVPVLHGANQSYTAEDLAAEMLRVLRDKAVAMHAGATFPVSGAPRRLLVTVPAQTDAARRDAMTRAGLRAGFTDVELLAEPVAAAFSIGAAAWPPGSVVLVYDLGGGTFDAALVEIGVRSHRVIGSAGLVDGHGGRDIDAAIFRVIWPAAEEWLSAVPGREEDRDEIKSSTLAAAVRLKQGLTATDPAGEGIAPRTRVELTRAQLTELTERLLRDTVDCCAKLVSDHGYQLSDVAGVLLVGGSTWMPAVRQYVTRHLTVATAPVPAPNPVYAVVQGAANWAEGADSRRADDLAPSTLRVPLRWALPEGRGTLVRWLAAEGDAYQPGAPIARVRLPPGSLYDLHARSAGRIEQQHVWPGMPVYSGTPLVTVLRPAAPADVRAEPTRVGFWPWAATALAVSPDGRRLAAVLTYPPAVAVLDAVSGAKLAQWQGDDRVTGLAWGHGARPAFGVSGGAGRGVRVLDEVPRGAAASRWLLTAQPAAVLDLAYLPGGREVAVLSGDGTVRVADVATGKSTQLLTLAGDPEILAVSGDGRWMAVSGGDSVQGFAHLLERAATAAGGWEFVLSWQLPAQVKAMSFSGNWLLLAGGGDGEPGYLRAVDARRSGQPDRDLPWHQRAGSPASVAVRALSAATEAGLFAAVTDTLTWIGDAGTGTPLGAVAGPGGPAVTFSPDGHWLYTASRAGTQAWALTELGRPANPDGEQTRNEAEGIRGT
jgi:actin-like ATPase involved in cell morphogenesis